VGRKTLYVDRFSVPTLKTGLSSGLWDKTSEQSLALRRTGIRKLIKKGICPLGRFFSLELEPTTRTPLW